MAGSAAAAASKRKVLREGTLQPIKTAINQNRIHLPVATSLNPSATLKWILATDLEWERTVHQGTTVRVQRLVLLVCPCFVCVIYLWATCQVSVAIVSASYTAAQILPAVGVSVSG
eukprot:GHUV01018152.1.p1 GENE.GHUV01018152.1~~GHUV01018152.1.p1  ORF type:complete len:116 (-),score=7.95 GHUV01018152.1:97-444(-)